MQRSRPEPPEQVATPVQPLLQELRGLLRAAVFGEPASELLGRLLRLQLRELRLLLREHRARLQLKQRRDQDQELAAGLEVELTLRLQVLDRR
jgi:hypothetical protein